MRRGTFQRQLPNVLTAKPSAGWALLLLLLLLLAAAVFMLRARPPAARRLTAPRRT